MQTPAVAQANRLCTYVGTFLSPNIEIEWQSTKKIKESKIRDSSWQKAAESVPGRLKNEEGESVWRTLPVHEEAKCGGWTRV